MTISDREAARRAARGEALCAATVRALTGDPALHYSGARLCRNMRPLPLHAPHLQTLPGPGDPLRALTTLRGAADGAAMRLRHSDAALHRRLQPDAPLERLLFELMEQLRCETFIPAGMPGIAKNLRDRFEAWSRAMHITGVADSHVGLLLYTVAQMSWSRLTGYPVVEDTEGLIEATRMAIAPRIGGALAGMRRTRADQTAFAVYARELAADIASLIRSAGGEQTEDKTKDDEDEKGVRNAFSLFLDFDEHEDDGITIAHSGDSRVLQASAQGYRVFTNRYDRELYAGTLVRRALLTEFRERLDERIVAQAINVPRLARALKAALAVPQRDGWSFGEEQGRIDGRRLAQLVSSPAERRLFRLEKHTLIAESMVSFLIDCSGSMKAQIEAVAMIVDVLSRALDAAGVTNEILGFTTGAWNGGRARSDWLARGKPRFPGRLNEVSHLIFKDAVTSWRRARSDIASLFKADLFREGVDGEAVAWACERLRSRSANRRLLIVISDGSPMDAATHQVNDDHYLDHHLREVVAQQQARGDVEVLGLGVGLDLSPYYRNSLALDLTSPPDMTTLSRLVDWIGSGGRRAHA
ncbi:cobaltochelatase CobT-related protein [Pandoraea apista]|uniref:cobaltochelatase CobT-related protein n=1 Tax=Pandoraea apista TaxID=93218 RepID=UPI000659DA2E|nr:cobalt chelatase [Pandoraea apista]ALS65668.1 cobalt chelatase [Pandoraea apista]RRW97888.1 cobalt chelatase [Pandoraea apista]RRX07079.1 cobalt chelatase [Pandoraea apista]CFB62534.1 Aerobic cobaltochelatase subunit CobT [Pandoraea apista]